MRRKRIIIDSNVTIGGILTFHIELSGSNYTVGEILAVEGGDSLATVQVTSVDKETRGITGLALITPGSDYVAETTYRLTHSPDGDGATIVVDTVTGSSTTFYLRHKKVL